MYFSEHFVPAEHYFPTDLFLSVRRLQNCTFGSKYLDCLTGSAEDICHHFVSLEEDTSRNCSNNGKFNNNGKIVWLANETRARRIKFQSTNIFKEH